MLKTVILDESAQGATEYILLLAIVVGLAMLFKGNITQIVREKMDEIAKTIAGIKPESN